MAFNDVSAMTAKITAAMVLFFLVFLCSWLPGRMITFLHRGLDNSLDQQRLQQVLTGMNCFAGGVFLATCLLDLLPEFRALITGAKGRTSSTDGVDFSESDTRTFAYRQRRLMIPKLSPSKDHEIINTCEKRQFLYDTPLNRLRRHSSLKSNSVIDNNNNCILTNSGNLVKNRKRRSLDLSVIILLLVLSAHCIFDGLTVGFHPRPPTPQALEVTIAVAIHKCVFAFSLGVQYAQSSQMSTGLNRSILCYSAASPIGIFTAFVFDNLSNLPVMLGSVVPAIATGTLAFKIFLDISPATCQT